MEVVLVAAEVVAPSRTQRWYHPQVEASRKVNQQAAVICRRRHRRSDDGIEKRISKAEALVHMGEVSSAQQALEGSSLAPGTEATLNALRDPSKRPREPRTPVPRELSSPEPRSLFILEEIGFCRNLTSARRGAAEGPFGMTVEHLQPLLDMPRDLRVFSKLERSCPGHKYRRQFETPFVWDGSQPSRSPTVGSMALLLATS